MYDTTEVYRPLWLGTKEDPRTQFVGNDPDKGLFPLQIFGKNKVIKMT